MDVFFVCFYEAQMIKYEVSMLSILYRFNTAAIKFAIVGGQVRSQQQQEQQHLELTTSEPSPIDLS